MKGGENQMIKNLIKVAKIVGPLLSFSSGIISDWANDKKMEATIEKKISEALAKRKIES